VEGTLAKVREEVDELGAAATDAERRDEVGDLLYALTSVCRHLGIDAEDALRAAARKFAERFRRVEAYAQARNLDLSVMSIAELDALWEEAKVDQARDEAQGQHDA
jgi:ATP diphosphatase